MVWTKWMSFYRRRSQVLFRERKCSNFGHDIIWIQSRLCNLWYFSICCEHATNHYSNTRWPSSKTPNLYMESLKHIELICLLQSIDIIVLFAPAYSRKAKYLSRVCEKCICCKFNRFDIHLCLLCFFLLNAFQVNIAYMYLYQISLHWISGGLATSGRHTIA